MIKEILIGTALAVANANTATFNEQITGNFQTENILNVITTDQTTGLTDKIMYYTVSNTVRLKINNAEFTLKGYVYNEERDTYIQTEDPGVYEVEDQYLVSYIDYYIFVNTATTELNSLNIVLEGVLNQLQDIQLGYDEEPVFQYLLSTELETNFVNSNYTFNTLEQLRTKQATNIYVGLETEITDNKLIFNATFDQPFNIVRMRQKINDWQFTIPTDANQMVYVTNNIFKTVTLTYNYDAVLPVQTTEYIDIPGLMFDILGMPFAWLSTAFNLTIFPGTMYELNIAHLFFAIIGSLILVIILKKVIK